jgi:uncharacterized protein (TIGR03086 family)
VDEVSDRYRRRADAFERRVAGVRPEQWSNPSPCARWDTRAVLGHIVDMHGVMLRPLGRGLSPAPSLEREPLATFRAARADVEALLDDPALAGTECDTPSGRMTVREHIDRVVSDDLVLHGWDLARSTGQDDTIDPVDLARMLPAISAIPAEVLEKLRTPGAFGPDVEVFGPEVAVAGDASPQARLLGLTGRDPDWMPPPGQP